MKVKKLEWIYKGNGFTKDSYDLYELTEYKGLVNARCNIPQYPNENLVICQPVVGEFKNFELAKQACQKHYNEFILSQIENSQTKSLQNDYDFLRKMKLILNAYIKNKDLNHLESLFQMIQDWKDEVKTKIDDQDLSQIKTEVR